MSILKVNNLSKVYGDKQSIKHLLVQVKTTLLNVLSSIDTISGGSVEVDGNEINKLSNKQLANFRKQLGFIFQDYSVRQL